jgi:hypothetical protein
MFVSLTAAGFEISIVDASSAQTEAPPKINAANKRS